MKNNNLVKFFVNGFYFANKNILYLLPAILTNFIIFIKPDFIGFLFLFFGIAYTQMLPLFFENIVNKKRNAPEDIVKSTVKASLRMILPVLFLIILLSFILVIYLTAKYGSISDGIADLTQISQNIPFVLTINILSSLFVFTPIFFSVENNNYFKALWNSLKFSIKEYKYFAIMAVTSIILSYLYRQIPYDDSWRVPLMLISKYFAFIILCISYFYYKSVVMAKSSTK